MTTRENVLSTGIARAANAVARGEPVGSVSLCALSMMAEKLELALSAKQAQLRKYGHHLAGCRLNQSRREIAHTPEVCTCGFAEAMGEK